jgi:hypothetical protein
VYDRLLGWIYFSIEGIFDRLKHRARFTDKRGNPSLAASFVALGDDAEALSDFFEFGQQVFV